MLKVVGDFAWEYSLRHGYVSDMSIDEFQNYRSSKMANCGLVMGEDFSKDIDKALSLKQIRLNKELQWDHLFLKNGKNAGTRVVLMDI